MNESLLLLTSTNSQFSYTSFSAALTSWASPIQSDLRTASDVRLPEFLDASSISSSTFSCVVSTRRWFRCSVRIFSSLDSDLFLNTGMSGLGCSSMMNFLVHICLRSYVFLQMPNSKQVQVPTTYPWVGFPCASTEQLKTWSIESFGLVPNNNWYGVTPVVSCGACTVFMHGQANRHTSFNPSSHYWWTCLACSKEFCWTFQDQRFRVGDTEWYVISLC